MKPAFSTIEPLEARIAPAALIVNTTADSGNGSLRAALHQADQDFAPGKIETIVFKLPKAAPGTENMISLTSGALETKGNIDIVGPGPGKLIINAGGNSRVFDINDGSYSTLSSATISGLSIIGGYSSTYGGGINCTENLTLKNVVISGNKGQADGGGVELYSKAPDFASVTITGSLITGNTSNAGAGNNNGGGGLLLANVQSVKISNSIISANSAPGFSGGGIFISTESTSKTLSITNTQITGNAADRGGGLAIYNISTVPVTITGSNISGNIATSTSTTGVNLRTGGGVYISKGSLAVVNSTISNNVAGYAGGGIAAVDTITSLTIKGSTISGNKTLEATSGMSAGQYFSGGGGIYLYSTGNTLLPVNITASKILDNHDAAKAGGGIDINGPFNIAISASTISGNATTGKSGGGIATVVGANGMKLSVATSVISNNTATTYGGGIASYAAGSTSIISSKITGNVVEIGSGGGLFIESPTSVLKSDIVSGNAALPSSSAYGAGGGAAIVGGNFQIIGGSFSGNYAGGGGGILAEQCSGSILGTTITGNVAKSSGGALYVTGTVADTITIQIAKVTGDTAPSHPDIFSAGSTTISYVV